MNCLLLSRYGRLGASSRMRFYQYLPFLESQRIHVETAALLDDSYIRNINSGNSTDWPSILGSYMQRVRSLARSRQFDLVWVEAEIFPWLPHWAELWLSWKRLPYVVDYDDAAFHRYDLHSVKAVRWLLGRKIDQVMKRAALVVAGNSYLANRARQAGSGRIVILPTVVDLRRYAPQPSRPGQRFRHRLDRIPIHHTLFVASSRRSAAGCKLGTDFFAFRWFWQMEPYRSSHRR